MYWMYVFDWLMLWIYYYGGKMYFEANNIEIVSLHSSFNNKLCSCYFGGIYFKYFVMYVVTVIIY